MENYKLSLKNRSQYALAIGTFDISSRVAAWRWLNGGWQKAFGGFEINSVRKLPSSLLTALISAPVSIPFELARMAYYGDKTFPKNL